MTDSNPDKKRRRRTDKIPDETDNSDSGNDGDLKDVNELMHSYYGKERRNMISRLATLEANMENMIDNFDRHLKVEEASLLENTNLVKEIRDQQIKMKGFTGGVLFVFSGVSVAIGMFIKHMLGNHT